MAVRALESVELKPIVVPTFTPGNMRPWALRFGEEVRASKPQTELYERARRDVAAIVLGETFSLGKISLRTNSRRDQDEKPVQAFSGRMGGLLRESQPTHTRIRNLFLKPGQDRQDIPEGGIDSLSIDQRVGLLANYQRYKAAELLERGLGQYEDYIKGIDVAMQQWQNLAAQA